MEGKMLLINKSNKIKLQGYMQFIKLLMLYVVDILD